VFQFEGEEFNLIIEGKVELRYGDERYILEEGDSVYIDGDIPYSGKSIGAKQAKVLAIAYRYKKEDIIAFCLERIAEFKVPRYIEYVDEFQRTASGKIQKHVLIGATEDLTADCYDRMAAK